MLAAARLGVYMPDMSSVANRFRKLLGRERPVVGVVRLEGVIAPSGGLGGRSLNDQSTAPLLERAFRRKPKAVALAINSPGGSPVQSALIAARVRRLAEKHEVPVYAFCEDVAASGGYWLATAADEIYADENSIVGSIGVISAGFGFQDLIARYGVERRVHTAGTNKGMLDPFQPEKDSDVARLKLLQKDMHESFIDHVRRRRGTRLSEEIDLFQGDIFRGAEAVGHGLIDGVGHLVPKLQEIFGDKVHFDVQRGRRGLMSRLGMAGGAGLAAEMAGGATLGALDAADERLTWARYGVLGRAG